MGKNMLKTRYAKTAKTPLGLAAESGKLNLVRLLVEKGANEGFVKISAGTGWAQYASHMKCPFQPRP